MAGVERVNVTSDSTEADTDADTVADQEVPK
jgi:hypothetical protein